MMTLTALLVAASLLIGSADGTLQVRLESPDNGPASYSVLYKGSTVMTPAPIGLVAQDCEYSQLCYLSHKSDTINVSYSISRAKTSRVDHKAVLHTVRFRTPEGREIDMDWHISAHDIAFRYSIPKDSETGSIRVMRELTHFNFPEGTLTYLCPQSDAMVGWKRSKPSYEEHYEPAAPLGKASEFGHGFTFPCLFNTPGGWVLISETGVDSHYCASRIGDYEPGNGYPLAFPMPEENNGNGSSEPAFALPGSTPWRTITVGGDLAPIVESTIAFDVVDPKYPASREYEYGKSSWSWILWQDASSNYDDARTFIDFAAEMGWPYSLIDAHWDRTIGRERMEELAAYARSKGVSLFLWYSSSGWWNDITQSPINIMCSPIERKREMRWLERLGVSGIKVDFFGGDKQETMRLYESILSDADDHGLMVIFHGCTLPRGWERMYPNYVGSEAVRASENLVFEQEECDNEALAATLHPFIRNAVGCMEFGGTILNRRLSRSNGAPDPDGVVRGTIRRTSDAFQLATAVLFQNPIQNFALAPNNLDDAPACAVDFMRRVPTTWDETRYISGAPGHSAVIARRNGSVWYVAAVNASEEPLDLDIAAIAAKLGAEEFSRWTLPESVEVLYTGPDGTLMHRTGGKFRKGLKVGKEDGAVVIIQK